MTIVLVGGGSGGHIIPLLAVAHKLKQKQPNIRLVAVVDKYTTFVRLLEESPDIATTYRISAGKYRRYPNQTFIQTMSDIGTLLLNIRDAFRTMVGVVQAYQIIRKERPNALFIKGGFVGVPVGVAARLQKRPFITHDSDTAPGLANRIIGRWAIVHAVGFNASLYKYKSSRIREVGVPVSSNYKPIIRQQQDSLKQQLGIPLNAKMILIVGGSQGSTTINSIVSKIVQKLLENANLYVIHQVGHGNSVPEYGSKRYIPLTFIPDLHRYTGAADIIVSRAGSFLAELAAQQKAVVVIPAPQLAGGHQIKNARYLAERKAVLSLQEEELKSHPEYLLQTLVMLLKNKQQREQLARELHDSFKHDAASQIASLLIDISKHK